jgi:hypothetical protein
LQAFGNNFLATAVIVGGLAWHLLHPVEDKAGFPVSPLAGSLSASGSLP